MRRWIQLAGIVTLVALEARGTTFNLSGETRLRWEYYGETIAGRAARDRDGYLLGRLLLNAHVRAAPWAVATQIISCSSIGRAGGPRPIDVDRADAATLYVEYSRRSGGLRLGRQEIVLGSGRLVGVRRGPNTRANFDALCAWFVAREWRFEAVVLSPVRPRAGAFDNETDRQRRLECLYLSSPRDRLLPGVVEFYLIHYSNDDARYARGRGRDRREMAGARWSGVSQDFGWNVECGLQTGRFEEHAVAAGAVALECFHSWPAASGHPYLGLRLNALSGDSGGTHQGTFQAFFPGPSFFGELKVFGPANLVDGVLALGCAPTRSVNVDVTFGVFRKASAADGIYDYSGRLLTPSTIGYGGGIGSQWTAQLEWDAWPRVTVGAAFSAIRAGAALRRSGGHDQHFVSTTFSMAF